MKCKDCQNYSFILSCTVDENGKHHSFNDEPAKIYKDGEKRWFKHGKRHRENNPSVIYHDGNFGWYYEDKFWIDTKEKPINNTILIDEINGIHYNKKYINKIAIVLKHMKEYDPNVYFCLIENEKLYIKVLD